MSRHGGSVIWADFCFFWFRAEKIFWLPSMHRKSQVSNRPSPLLHIFVGRLPDDTVEAVLEPLHGLGLVDLVAGTDGGLRAAALGNTLTGAGPSREMYVSGGSSFCKLYP